VKEKLLVGAAALFLWLQADVADAADVMACEKIPDAINLYSNDGGVRRIVFKKSSDGLFVKKHFEFVLLYSSIKSIGIDIDGNTVSLSIVSDGRVSPISLVVKKDSCSLYFIENLFLSWVGAAKN